MLMCFLVCQRSESHTKVWRIAYEWYLHEAPQVMVMGYARKRCGVGGYVIDGGNAL